VTKLENLSSSLASAIKDSSSVIFAASASKEGGNPNQVDKQGLVNVAKLCIANKVPRLVIVSSGAVTKPFSPVYLFLNLFGGIMKAKNEGESEVRRLYSSPEAKGLGYTIVRPGGLTEDPPRGVQAIELNQGDDYSGRISRW
jgi:nucleoside-diphosphate-sugar epimerase